MRSHSLAMANFRRVSPKGAAGAFTMRVAPGGIPCHCAGFNDWPTGVEGYKAPTLAPSMRRLGVSHSFQSGRQQPAILVAISYAAIEQLVHVHLSAKRTRDTPAGGTWRPAVNCTVLS